MRMPAILSSPNSPPPNNNEQTPGSPGFNDDDYEDENTELIPERVMLDYIQTTDIDNEFIKNKMIEIRNSVDSSNRIEIKEKIIQNISLCPNPLTHGKRNFDNLFDIYKTPDYVSYVCMSTETIFKLVNCKTHNVSDFMMIKEIAFQYYAKYLSSNDDSSNEEKCDFTVPEIISYGRLVIDKDESPEFFNRPRQSKNFGLYGKYKCFWFIEMERLKYDTLYDSLSYINLDDENICNKLSEKIKKLESCLKSKNFHHNDYHAHNIFYNRDNDKIGLIDYGISDLTGRINIRRGVDYNCQLLKEIKHGKTKNGGKKHKSKTRNIHRTRRRYKLKTRRRHKNKTRKYN